MVNKVILLGNLGRDPETHTFYTGDKVVSFSVATTERWKNKEGEKVEATEWHNVKVFRKLADICEQYLKAGSKVYIEGKLKTTKFQDKDGHDRYKTEIVCNEMKMLGGNSQGGNVQDNAQNSVTTQQGASVSNDSNNGDTDLPF